MATAASRIRTSAAVAAAGAVPLIVVAALGNQGLSGWRATQAGSSNHWVADLMQSLTFAGWRFSPGSGPNATAHWAAPLAFNIALIVLTTLLAAAAARGRGAVGLLFGVWGAAALAGAGAGLIATPLAYTGVRGGAGADAYRDALAQGMILGFLVGVVAALAATAAAAFGASGTRNDSQAEAPETTRSVDETWPLSS
jgi:hypothetical protein